MKALAMLIFRTALRLCYLPFKLLPTQHKIVFLSRQANKPSLDFMMLSQEIARQDPSAHQVMLCQTLEAGFGNKLKYSMHMLRQMAHLATAQAAVLDGYCITACLLHHKKGLKIYQLWHALGLLKNFGFAAVDRREGSSLSTAQIMCMHRGYHRILCSAPSIAPQLARCYNAPVERMLPLGLPRIDFLTDSQLLAEMKQQIMNEYPLLQDNRPIILYVPTFRKQSLTQPLPLEDAIDLNQYHFVVKEHDGTQRIITKEGELTSNSQFTGLEWLAAADYVVTDYSAILFEAFTAGRPVYLYCYDRKEYEAARGLAIPYDSIPAPLCTTPRQVADAIEAYKPTIEAVRHFCNTYVTAQNLQVTKALSYLILAGCQGDTPTFEEIQNNPAFQK